MNKKITLLFIVSIFILLGFLSPKSSEAQGGSQYCTYNSSTGYITCQCVKAINSCSGTTCVSKNTNTFYSCSFAQGTGPANCSMCSNIPIDICLPSGSNSIDCGYEPPPPPPPPGGTGTGTGPGSGCGNCKGEGGSERGAAGFETIPKSVIANANFFSPVPFNVREIFKKKKSFQFSNFLDIKAETNFFQNFNEEVFNNTVAEALAAPTLPNNIRFLSFSLSNFWFVLNPNPAPPPGGGPVFMCIQC